MTVLVNNERFYTLPGTLPGLVKPLSCGEGTLPQQVEPRSPVHLPLQRLQACHLLFYLAIRPAQHAPGAYRRLVLPDLGRELPDLT